MKKVIFLFAIAACLLQGGLFAQSSAEVRQAVAAHGQDIEALSDGQAALRADSDSLALQLKQIGGLVATIAQDGGAITKPVRSQEDANTLFGVVFGILNLIVTGLALSFKPVAAWVDRYASKSVLTVAGGLVFTAVAWFTSRGEASIFDIVGYLVTILGTHFGLFTVFRKKAAAAPSTAAN